MAAPRYVPLPPTDRASSYDSPTHVPSAWSPDRPAELEGRQPTGARLGAPGPDQGYVLVLAERFRSEVVAQAGEHVDDALSGCTAIAMRRSALFGRAPVVHDLSIALTMWGWLDPSPPAELVATRLQWFAATSHVAHHYAELRRIVDAVPEATLRMTPAQVAAAYPARWRELTGA